MVWNLSAIYLQQLLPKWLPSPTCQNQHRRVQLPSFYTLFSALSCRVSSLWVRSFVTKVALLQLILWHWVTTGCMRLCLSYPADNARLQLRYLFGFHSLLFHINKIHLVNASNQMIHPKRHWDYKSFMMPKANKSVKSLRRAPSCIRTKRFQLLEPFEILQFYKSSYTVARVARLIFSKKPKLSKNKAKNG